MSTIRLRVEVNKGRIGASLRKLGDVATEIEKFLRMLADDVGLDSQGNWLAMRFSNGSVRFDAEYEREVNAMAVRRYLAAMERVTDCDPSLLSDFEPTKPARTHDFRFETLHQFTRITDALDYDESLGFGFYYGMRLTRPSHWKHVSQRNVAPLRELLESPVNAYGSIQGVIHSWFKGSSPAYFRIRNLQTDDLVNCYYRPTHYAKVWKALQREWSVVHVSGSLQYSRVTQTIERCEIDDIMSVAPLSAEEFERFFGSSPDFTAGLSTEEFIEEVRSDGA